MKPLYIKLNNFLSYKDNHKIDFSNINSCVITGNNGTGKSTLLIDSILFSLFGQARQRGEECLSLGESTGFVEFSFLHNNKTYIVSRFLKKNVSKLSLCEDGVDISGSTLTESQNIINNKILGFSRELFLNIGISQQGQIDTFSEQSPQDKQNLLSEIIQTDKWDIRKKLANNKIKELQNNKKELDSLLENLDILKEKLVSIEQEIQKTKKDIENTDFNLTEYKKQEEILYPKFEEIRKQKESYKTIDADLQQYLKELRFNQNSLAEYRESKEFIEKETELLDSKTELELEINKFNNRVNDNTKIINYFNEQLKLIEYINKGYQDIQFIEDVPCKDLDIYHYCKLLSSSINKKKELDDLVKNNFKKDLLTEKKELYYLLEKIENENKEIKSSLSYCYEFLNKNTRELDNIARHKKLVANFDVNTVTSVITNLSTKIKELTKLKEKSLDNSIFLEYNSLVEKIDSLNIDLQELKAFLNYQEGRKVSIFEQIDSINKKLENNSVDKELSEWKYLYNLYDRIPTLLLFQIVPVIEEEANKILKLLNVNYYLQLKLFEETKTTKTQKKAINIMYISPEGEIPFESLSGSEKFKQSLALRIALSKTLNQINQTNIDMFVIDEGFGALDQNGLQNIKEVILQLSKLFSFFCIITHVEEIKDSLNYHINVSNDINNRIVVIK